MSSSGAGPRLPAVRALSTVSSLPSSSPAPTSSEAAAAADAGEAGTSRTAVAAAASSAPMPSSSSSSSSSSSPLPALLPLTSPYPFASAPDIIRAHQKDAYFAGTLANDLADLVLRFAGGRTAHAWATETRTAAELAYFGLTAWLGHRTLGEEYCDLMEVVVPESSVGGHDGVGAPLLIPPPLKRSAYVLTSVLAPYLVGRTLPGVRRALRRRLEAKVAQLEGAAALAAMRKTNKKGQNRGGPSLRIRFLLPIYRYLLTHLDSVTSGTHVRAVTLALFYFYGAYYTLTTRLLGLRYVFTRRRQGAGGGGGGSSSDDVVGYEVLGALLVLQLAVQGYVHIRDTLTSSSTGASSSSPRFAGPVQVSLDHDHTYTANNELLLGGVDDTTTSSSPASNALAAMTNTPDTPRDPDTGGPGYRFSLEGKQTMKWLGSRVQRQCTLCLEMLKDPAATPCGHVFCWRCIGDWVREKPECPLCRRAAQPQHILPLQAL